MKLVGKSETAFVPAEPRRIDAASGLILPDHLVAQREEESAAREREASRPWSTVEELYQTLREGGSRMSRGKFKGQLRKMLNRGLAEIDYGGKEPRVRLTSTGRKAAA